MASRQQCVKCSGDMEQGFMVDRGDMHMKEQAEWASGEPNRSFWRGSTVESKERTLPVTTLRCKTCGYLEFYALPKR